MAFFIVQIIHKQWYKNIWLITICCCISDRSFRCGCGVHWSSTDVDYLPTTFTHWLLAAVGYYWLYWYWLDLAIISNWHFLCSILDQEFVIYRWERHFDFFRPNCCLNLFSACWHSLNKKQELCWNVTLMIIGKSVSIM